MTARAIWNGVVLAESDKTVIVEGNHYFPSETIKPEYFRQSSAHTICGWKGEASYYDIVVGDETNIGGAWYYADPFPAAAEIRDYVAFWRGVIVAAPDGDGTPGPATRSLEEDATAHTNQAECGKSRSRSRDRSRRNP